MSTASRRKRSAPAGALPLPMDHEVLRVGDGARLAVTIEGHGPPIVLLHGWATDRSVWNEVSTMLVDAGHQVVRYDLRGHGRSTVGSGDLSMARLVADLDAVLDATSINGAVVVGHSLGSLTALVYLSGGGDPAAAERAQARVRAAVLASAGIPNPKVGPVMLAVSEWAMRSRAVEWLFRRERLGLAMLDPSGNRVPAHVRAERAAFLATSPEVRSGLLATIQHDFVPGLGPYRTPTTLIVGSQDRFVEPALVRQLADLLPNVACIELPGRGHNLPYEAPGALVDAVIAAAGCS